MVLESGLEVESVAPADDDVNSVYQYLIGATGEGGTHERGVLAAMGGVLRLELKKTFLSKRGWWIYVLALGPLAVVLIHWRWSRAATAGRVITAWARTA